MRTIFVQRMVNGAPVKWRMDVDENMVVLSEGPADSFNDKQPNMPVEAMLRGNAAMHAHIAELQASARSRQAETNPGAVKSPQDHAVEAYKRALDSRGIKYTVNDKGQVIVTNVPVREKQIIQFFDLDQPTPDVPGMEDIRTNYKNELEQMQASSCTTCQINALQRKYRDVLMRTVFSQ